MQEVVTMATDVAVVTFVALPFVPFLLACRNFGSIEADVQGTDRKEGVPARILHLSLSHFPPCPYPNHWHCF